MRSLICPSTPTSASSAFFCFFLVASFRSRPPGSPEAIIMVSLMNSAIVSAYDFCRISLYAGTSQRLTASRVNLGWLKSQRFFSLPPSNAFLLRCLVRRGTPRPALASIQHVHRRGFCRMNYQIHTYPCVMSWEMQTSK